MSQVIEQQRYTCALAAQQTVAAIPKAHPIVHAGPGCADKVWTFAAISAANQGEGYAGGNTISCTNSGETEVVFGGEKKLTNLVSSALKVLDGDLYVVLTGCTSDIVGDDSISVAKRFAKEGYPVVGTETAGFKGNSYYGHNTVVNAIIEQFVGEREVNTQKGLVNVFTVVPYQDPYWRGDLQEIKSLLEAIGLEVNILYGTESEGIKEWENIPNAEFNLLVSPWVGLDTVKLLERKYGTPYLHYPVLPIGAKETSQFLRTVAQFAKLDQDKVEKVIKKEEKRYYEYFEGLIDYYSENRQSIPTELFTVADSTYGVSVANFLVNEFGVIPKGLYLTDNPTKAKQKLVKEIVAEKNEKLADILQFEPDGWNIQEDIKEKIRNPKRAILFGSTWEKILAQQLDAHYVYLSIPIVESVIINKSYVGYRGALTLLEDYFASIYRVGYHGRQVATDRVV